MRVEPEREIAAVFTVKEREAVGPKLPRASRARTWKVWAPSPRCVVVFGEAQAANEPPSSLHWSAEAPSFEWKVKVGVGSLVVPAGPESMIAVGSESSKAPMSAPLPPGAFAIEGKSLGRLMPRWSTDSPAGLRPWSIAGLPGWRA